MCVVMGKLSQGDQRFAPTEILVGMRLTVITHSAGSMAEYKTSGLHG